MREFTVPPGPGGPILLEISLPAGTRALWVPPVGDPALSPTKATCSSPRRIRLAVRAEREEAGILVLDCEVAT